MKNITGISNANTNYREVIHFRFEEDFMEDNIRCIPMIVRFKLDACGIKLKLKEWSRLSEEERIELTYKPCITRQEVLEYKISLTALVQKSCGNTPTHIPAEENPYWAQRTIKDERLKEKLSEMEYHLSDTQWQQLSDLQRFALLKLCRPGH